MQIMIGSIIAGLIAYTAFRTHSLNRGGALAAVMIGTIVFGLGGWNFAILLLTFFITSSILTRVFKTRNKSINEEYSKGGERDAGQVLGNGMTAAFLVLSKDIILDGSLAWVLFAVAIAAVNADTWATEIGALSPGQPRMITNLHKSVDKGTSGGVTTTGTLAALLGSGLIGLLGALLAPDGFYFRYFPLIATAGFLGSLIDSLLGATLQAMYYCPSDQKLTEKHPIHTCGTKTSHVRGWRWLNNDWVNFTSSVISVLLIFPFVLFSNGN